MNCRRSSLPLVAILAAGCGGGAGGSGSDNPTLVAVDPDDFLGDVPCLESPGAMRRFVATLEDVSSELGSEDAPIESFVLPSSPPVACTHPVAFGFVVPEHRYVADVQGYDRTDLTPMLSGSPVMLDPATGEVVAPRWTTSCGRQNSGTDRAVVARKHLTINVRGCTLLVDHNQTASPTAVQLRLGDALGDLECGGEPGMIESFRAVLLQGSEAAREAACDSSVTFDGLEPDAAYTFALTALEGGTGAPRWNTTCFAVARSGATVTAVCDPLLTMGSIEVDVPELLAEAGEECSPEGIFAVVASLTTDAGLRTAEQTHPDCLLPLRFEDVEAGSYELSVQSSRADGSPGPSAACQVEVYAGQVGHAACVLL
jgi:hypothetical protein